MARTKRAYTKTKAKLGRKVILRQRSYTLELKAKARAWKKFDNMKTSAIQKKLKDEYQLDVALSTLSTWWNPKFQILSTHMIRDTRHRIHTSY